MFRYRCPLKPPVFPIRAVTIDTLMEGLSSIYIYIVCDFDNIHQTDKPVGSTGSINGCLNDML